MIIIIILKNFVENHDYDILSLVNDVGSSEVMPPFFYLQIQWHTKTNNLYEIIRLNHPVYKNYLNDILTLPLHGSIGYVLTYK